MRVQTRDEASGGCLYGAAFLQRRPCARLYSPPRVGDETGFKGRAAKRRDLPQLFFREVVPLQLARQIGGRGVQPPRKLLFGYVHFNQQRIDFFRHHIYTFCSFRACASRSPKLTESLSSPNVHFIINDYVRKRQTKICFVGKRFCCFYASFCSQNHIINFFKNVICVLEQRYRQSLISAKSSLRYSLSMLKSK